MNKKNIIKFLSALFLTGAVSPLVSANDTTVTANTRVNNISLNLVENPFPELKQGYLLNNSDNYRDSIIDIIDEYMGKYKKLGILIKKLNSEEKQFKDFCDEILKEESDNYSKYFEKWNNYINDKKNKLTDYNAKLDSAINSGKKLILLLESHKCYLKHNSQKPDNNANKLINFLVRHLNMLIANKHYCNLWIKYAEDHSDLSNYDKNTINSISKFPDLDDSVKQTKGEITSWYENLFTSEK